MKIWFITRSFYPIQNEGGALIRFAQVDNLKKLGWNITVVMPNYYDNNLKIEDNVVQIPFFHIQKLASLFEKIGIYEDYLDIWVKNAYNYLKDKVLKDDIIFATSGGELASIKLASKLKEEINCKFIINFHDPIVYTLVNGLKVDKKPHISREKSEQKYISNANLIITSSSSFKDALLDKYSSLNIEIVNNYFGYMKEIEVTKREFSKAKKLHIAYSGSMRSVQRPEILYEAYKLLKNRDLVELYFIGDFSNYSPIKNLKDVNLIPYMKHEDFLSFMSKNIDIGFVSLANDYYSVCVPSKIYEYINLELPILAALPNGDALDMINDNGYGKCVYFKDKYALRDAIELFLDRDFLINRYKNIIKDKKRWSMREKILEVDLLLRNLK